MLFNTFVFWFFFAAVIAIYPRLAHRQQNRLLLVASYIFYGAWDWRFLSLIFASTVVDFLVARQMGSSSSASKRKALVTTSVVVNLGILGLFKYYGFFARELTELLSLVGLPELLPTLDIVLPVGISFYTFQTMSYTIDVYRGKTAATDRFLDFALYVSFFPQLVAGPIERSDRLMPQILSPRTKKEGEAPHEQFQQGLYLVATGLFKKIVVADNMATVVDGIFATPPDRLTGPLALLGVYAFAFQIYGDFSGYSAIARGVARWLGFDLMVNFRMPYFARDPSDFWRRWHISLSSWLRDYLYIPLGGNRGGPARTYRNLALTMILGGIWHGAAWTFVWWGVWHGFILCLYRWIQQRRTSAPSASIALHLVQIVVMFHLVCVGWLLFRAESMHQVWNLATSVVSDGTFDGVTLGVAGTIVFYALPLMVFELWVERRRNLYALLESAWTARAVVYGYIFCMLWFFPTPSRHEFIYFQF